MTIIITCNIQVSFLGINVVVGGLFQKNREVEKNRKEGSILIGSDVGQVAVVTLVALLMAQPGMT